jgi:hypothetical protein
VPAAAGADRDASPPTTGAGSLALREVVERRRRDPKFKTRLQRIIDEDRELLERLAK